MTCVMALAWAGDNLRPVTSTATDGPPIEYKQCATCGFATPATRTRCHNCWNRLSADAPLLDPEHAANLVARQEIFAEERAETDRARTRRRRFILGGIALLVLLWFGWWIYSTFIYSPPPVPEASNPSLELLSGEDVWATANGDRLGTRQVGAAVDLDAPEAWSLSLGAAPATPLVADAERVYVVTEDRIAAVAASDGSLVWERDLQGAPYGAPTLAGGRLYIGLRAGQLLALDAATGDLVFQSLNTGTRFGASPMIVDGYAYLFGIGDVVAFDAEDGEILWSTPNRGAIAFTSPVVMEDYIAGVTGTEVLVFDRGNGAQTYFYEFTRANPYSTLSRDGVVYASSRRYTVAFEDTSGRPWWEQWRAVWNQFWIWGMTPDVPIPERLWQNNAPPLEDGFPGTFAGDLLILADRKGEMQALRLADGTEAWRVPAAAVGAVVAGPLSTRSGILLPFEDRVALYDPASGALLGERTMEGERLTDVLVTSGGLYTLDAGGTLTAFR